MTSIKQEADIIKYRKNKHLNIGIVIFGIIFIYLIATIIMYLTAPHVTVYEVRQGSILKDNAYTGLAIREETVVYAEEDGYLNYYAEDNSKVRVGTRVYTLSDTPLVFKETVANSELLLSEEASHSLILKIQGLHEQFTESDFSSVYQTKNEMQNYLNQITNQNKLEQLDSYTDLQVKTSSKDGVIVYYTDNMEDISEDTFSLEQFDKSNYKKTEFKNNNSVAAGQPIYKIITSDKWSLIVKISDETKDALTDKSRVKVNFKKDNQKTWASLTLVERDGVDFAILSFKDSMIRYANERYLDIELILEDESGLKIPKSSETTKDFYVVPSSYLTQGGNSSSDGVMRQTTNADGDVITEFLPVTVYYEDEEMLYLDPNAFDQNDVLIKPDSTENYPLKETRSLKGVYCINKGYAVFKQIQILCESEEYYIIEEGNSFGLSNYDHIALNSNNIKENDVVF